MLSPTRHAISEAAMVLYFGANPNHPACSSPEAEKRAWRTLPQEIKEHYANLVRGQRQDYQARRSLRGAASSPHSANGSPRAAPYYKSGGQSLFPRADDVSAMAATHTAKLLQGHWTADESGDRRSSRATGDLLPTLSTDEGTSMSMDTFSDGDESDDVMESNLGSSPWGPVATVNPQDILPSPSPKRRGRKPKSITGIKPKKAGKGKDKKTAVLSAPSEAEDAAEDLTDWQPDLDLKGDISTLGRRDRATMLEYGFSDLSLITEELEAPTPRMSFLSASSGSDVLSEHYMRAPDGTIFVRHEAHMKALDGMVAKEAYESSIYGPLTARERILLEREADAARACVDVSELLV